MPAVIAHYQFGREIYNDMHSLIGESKDEFDAFMLGCQGPDIMFYSVLDPSVTGAWELGTKMHRSAPVELFMNFAHAIEKLPDEINDVGVAYMRGLLCHYCLDSSVHPLVYAQQDSFCKAGIDGLDEAADHEVHAEIESELDILVLSCKAQTTIKDFNPAKRALIASKRTTDVISYLYKNVAAVQFGASIEDDTYAKSLDLYKAVLAILHSPSGVKKKIFGKIERLFRNHSFLEAMAHKNTLIFESSFDNRMHDEWTDPGTLEKRTDSFWDLYIKALEEAKVAIQGADIADREFFETLTCGFDFRGYPTRALLISVEDADQ